jgi:hypothetical protein
MLRHYLDIYTTNLESSAAATFASPVSCYSIDSLSNSYKVNYKILNCSKLTSIPHLM